MNYHGTVTTRKTTEKKNTAVDLLHQEFSLAYSGIMNE